MADIVYLYPQTSCPECNSTCEKPTGFRSNLSVRGGKVPECMYCYNRIGLSSGVQPVNKQGWVQINPQVYSDKYDPSFGKIPCKPCKESPSYISADPRLYSPTHADYLPLDQPPINGDVRLKNIYDEKWDNYGKSFEPYKEIKDGQIMYYVDRSIEDAYFKPVFATEAQEVAVLYRDPMDAMKPEYSRLPLNPYNPMVKQPCEYKDGLSFIEDTQSHREDLLSYQMRRRNQERWDTRWSS